MFRDRVDAGRRLAEQLTGLRGQDPIVLGLPRGGVPVAAEVARALGAPLDVLVVRKVGVPWQPELALGAVGEDGISVLNPTVVAACGLPTGTLDRLIERAAGEVAAVLSQVRGDLGGLDVCGRLCVVVDDGAATGATARAGAAILKHRKAGRVVLAVPVAAPEVAAMLQEHFDEVICVMTPPNLGSVGQWYQEFRQVSTGEVRRILQEARASAAGEVPR
jgi:putative phosphoribosyl transferase